MTPADGNLRIVVGIDGSPSSRAALAWARALAAPGDEVHAVACERAPEDRDALDREWAPNDQTDRPFHLHVFDEDAEEILSDFAVEAQADLLVIGAHEGLIGTPRILGSLTHRLLRTSPCPLAVVPESTPTGGPVVAGVGDGPATRASIDWAAWFATREQRPVHLVRGVSIRPIFGVDHAVEVMASYIDSRLLTEWARAEVDLVASELTERGLEVTTTVEVGRAGRTLVDAAAGARVVVVGKHLDGPITGYFAGVTLHHVLTHAPCPVVVVAATATDAADDPTAASRV